MTRRRIPDKALHEEISRIIKKEKVGLTVSAWEHHTGTRWERRNQLFQLARQRKFFGHGSWAAYLKEHHKIAERSPVISRSWPTERIHKMVAVLSGEEMFPIEKYQWQRDKSEKRSYFGKSLHNLYFMAYRSNRGDKRKETFFGKGSWAEYVKWARENYGKETRKA